MRDRIIGLFSTFRYFASVCGGEYIWVCGLWVCGLWMHVYSERPDKGTQQSTASHSTYFLWDRVSCWTWSPSFSSTLAATMSHWSSCFYTRPHLSAGLAGVYRIMTSLYIDLNSSQQGLLNQWWLSSPIKHYFCIIYSHFPYLHFCFQICSWTSKLALLFP